jgi:hypothetical protein
MNQHAGDLHLITMLGRAVLLLILSPPQQLRKKDAYLFPVVKIGTRSGIGTSCQKKEHALLPLAAGKWGNRPRQPLHCSATNVSLIER